MADENTSGGLSSGGGSDNYSPVLAKIMKLNPSDVTSGNLSLLGLGRQAMGADTEEYQKIQKQVDAAQDTLNKALQSRSSGLDPKYLALAAGLFNPGGGGGFFEGLGKGMTGYNAAAMEEDKRNRDIAQAQLALAQQKRAEMMQASQLGLGVAKSLAPGMTAEQKAVFSMGVDPYSPEGKKKVEELMAKKEATPDMKKASSQLGVPISDPSFAQLFQTWEEDQKMQPMAVRLGLNLKSPLDRNVVSTEMNRETKFKELPLEAQTALLAIPGGDPLNPDHMKIVASQVATDNALKKMPEALKAKLAAMNGDPLNPSHVKAASLQLSEDQGLERNSKQAQIRASNAATNSSLAALDKTRQEIQENTRNGDTSALVGYAKNAGIPVPTNISLPGSNPKERAAYMQKQAETTSKYVTETIAPLVNSVDDDIKNLMQAKEINSKVPMGGPSALIPGVTAIKTAMDPQMQVFKKLSNKTYAAQKIPGDHNISNADMKFYGESTFGPNNSNAANAIIIDAQLAQRLRDKDYNAYMTKWSGTGGSVAEGNRYWKDYVNANPVTARDPNGEVILNPNRMTYQQYFSAPRRQYDSQGREIQ